MMTAYYNEIDKYAAQWLRNLIAAGLIAPGDVDERDIRNVAPDDLVRYTQCHFFAGIGGWSYALRLAGWADERPVWTGSCPCQPFSLAGKQGGFDDPRHLWPEFKRLIAERRPPVVFGEQVASASDWLRVVRGDLEEMEYAVGCLPIEAASADAEHFRDRYWFVADRDGRRGEAREQASETSRYRHPAVAEDGADSAVRLAHHDSQRQGDGCVSRGGEQRGPGCDQEDRGGVVADGQSQRVDGRQDMSGAARRGGTEIRSDRPLVHAPGLGWGEGWTEHEFRSRGFSAAVASIDGRQYVECPDGKWRRLPPPRVRWLGTGIPSRVAKLRAYGNAIDPRPASEFIRAYLDCRP